MHKDTSYLFPPKAVARMAFAGVVVGALVALIGGAIFFSGCDTAHSPGGGFLTVTVGTGTIGEAARANESARTLYPVQSDCTRYELSFDGPAIVEPRSFEDGTPQTVELLPGDWTITITAFIAGTGDAVSAGTETAVASGSAEVPITAGETTTRHITLTPIASGAQGTFSYAVTLPAAAVTAAVLTINGGSIDLLAISPTEGIRAGTISLDAGYYRMGVLLTKDTFNAGKTEVVHIYSGLTTEAAFIFTDNDLAVPVSPLPPPPPAGGLALIIGFAAGDITIEGSDGSNVLSKTGAGGLPTTLTLHIGNAAGYSNCAWSVDGMPVSGSPDGSLSLNAAAYEARNHSVTFVGDKDGIPYSQTIPFTVLQAVDPIDPIFPAAPPDPENPASPGPGEGTEDGGDTEPAANPNTLPITVGAAATTAEVSAAITAALAGAETAAGGVWTLQVTGLQLNATGLKALYTGAAAALPNGGIALDLSACTADTGGVYPYTQLSTSRDEQKALRNRFTAITLPASVTSIAGGEMDMTLVKSGLGSFASLTSLSAPGVTSLGQFALRSNSALVTVSLPEAVTLGLSVFRGCIGLSTLTLPKVENVAASVFAGCTALVTVKLPAVKTLGDYCFNDDTLLTDLTLGAVPPTLGLIFHNLNNQPITFRVPAGTKPAYEAAYGAAPWGGVNVTVEFVVES